MSFKNRLSALFIGLGLFCLGVLFFKGLDTLDQQRADWAVLYEECVFEQYGMTPAYYHVQHGAYPVCDVSIYKETK